MNTEPSYSADRRRPASDIFVTVAAGIFVGAALFEVLPEAAKELGFGGAVGLEVLGLLLWALLKRLTDLASKSALAIVSSVAFWLHSALEGTVLALSLKAGPVLGLLVGLGLLLHLLPEFFAITSLLRGEGVSMKTSVKVDLGGIATLIIVASALYLLLPSPSESGLASLEAIVGGALLYIGAVSFWKRRHRHHAALGLGLGLVVALLWRVWF